MERSTASTATRKQQTTTRTCRCSTPSSAALSFELWGQTPNLPGEVLDDAFHPVDPDQGVADFLHGRHVLGLFPYPVEEHEAFLLDHGIDERLSHLVLLELEAY